MTTDTGTSADVLDRQFYVAGSCLIALLHVGLAVFFYAVDKPGVAHWDVAAVCVHLIGAAFCSRGRLLLGTWIVLGSGVIHAGMLVVVLGPDTGFGYYLLVAAGAAYVFLRPYPRHMAAATLFIIAMAAAVIANSRASHPWLALDDSVIDVLHAGNLFAATATMVAIAFLIVQGNRRTQQQLTRLRQEVAEARQLGQYTLGEKLGEGGMGQVYRATHALLRRPAAIKLLPEGEVTDAAMRRFEREVQLTSELTHPNTISIFDYGHTPEGVFYYVMEYLDGLDLGTLVDQYGRQPPGRVVHILRQVCQALEEAHVNGLVHRDIKPPNIILCERGNQPDVVKVLDFGLVKDLGAEAGTMENIVAGTPAYLSPEAITQPDSVGPASDLYALGAVGYFLLTGEQVFERATLPATLAAHLLDRPTPPHVLLGVPVPEVLEELVLSCLDKDPANRPQSAQALRRALDAVELEDAWSEEDARAWWVSHEQSDLAAKSTQPSGPIAHALSMTVDVGSREASLDLASGARREGAGRAPESPPARQPKLPSEVGE